MSCSKNHRGLAHCNGDMHCLWVTNEVTIVRREGCTRPVSKGRPMLRWLLGPGLALALMLTAGTTMADGVRAPIADVPLVDTQNLDDGDHKRGERYFYERIYGGCGVCHTLVRDRKWIGSSLYGIFGRKAGTIEGFVYSLAMRESGIVWDAKSIDRLIQNPRAFVPGTRMYYKGIPGPQHAQIRRDIIAFLKEATR